MSTVRVFEANHFVSKPDQLLKSKNDGPSKDVRQYILHTLGEKFVAFLTNLIHVVMKLVAPILDETDSPLLTQKLVLF